MILNVESGSPGSDRRVETLEASFVPDKGRCTNSNWDAIGEGLIEYVSRAGGVEVQ